MLALLIMGIIAKNKLKSKQIVELSKEEVNAEIQQESYKQEEIEENKNWEIEIPKISLKAQISEGTDSQTLNKYVGHFSMTPKEEGNVGLAAHNKGYPINYFENLKYLEGGEEIIYTHNNFSKTYIVTKNIKISDTDWSHLENTRSNEITLITCIENEPEYRRCVQATEKEAKD